MPLPMGPDRTKGKISGMIIEQMRPSFASGMRKGNEKSLHDMQYGENEAKEEKEFQAAGSMALRAMFSAMQSGDFNAAYQAYVSVHSIVDAQIEEEEEETGMED